MANTLGNDVSKFQGDINFDTYKSNSQFLICKASEGNGYKDPKLDRNKSEARRTGVLLGYYHFARPDLGNTPQQEADWFLKAIGDFKEGELLALDYESNWNGDVVSWCKSFLDRLREKLGGYNALIYLNQSHMSLNWQPVIDSGTGLWIAAYTFDPNKNNFNKGKWPFAAMQQWTDDQNVPGISGAVDGNVFFGDLDTLKKYCYHPVIVPPPTPPTSGTDDEKKALEVLKNHFNTSTDLNNNPFGNLEGYANTLTQDAYNAWKNPAKVTVSDSAWDSIKRFFSRA